MAIPITMENTAMPSLTERLAKLTSTRREVLAAHELARAHMQRHLRSKFTPFKEGDKVWLEATHLHFPNRPRKFSPKREGPFTITKVLSPLTYQLKLPDQWRIHPIFHASLLSPFRETTTHGPAQSEPPPDIIDNHEEYEVEAIHSHSGKGKRRKYWVKWKGYSEADATWEPISNLTHISEMLSQYNKQHKIASLIPAKEFFRELPDFPEVKPRWSTPYWGQYPEFRVMAPEETIKVKKVHEEAKVPTKGSAKAAGWDLYSIEDQIVPSHGQKVIDMGIAIAIPDEAYGQVAPRSGLAVKAAISVGAGVIDSDYRGSIKVLLMNNAENDFVVHKGDRIAQLIFEQILVNS